MNSCEILECRLNSSSLLVSKLHWLHLKHTLTDLTAVRALKFDLFLTTGKAALEGSFRKHSEQKYLCSPLRIMSLSSCLVFEHSKCSNKPQTEQTPTAALLLKFNPPYLHGFATHLASGGTGTLGNLLLPVDLTLWRSSSTIFALTASTSSFSLYVLLAAILSHHGRKKVATKGLCTGRFPKCGWKIGFSPWLNLKLTRSSVGG